MARSQGSALLINYFFGTAVNGAFAVAKNMDRHVFSFANRFQEAAGPQVIQSYSSGDNDRIYFLTSKVGKGSMILMTLVFFPLWAEMDFVLHLWLAEVPDGALAFCRMILLMVFVAVTDGGLGNVVNASGRIARFQTTYSLITLSCIPLGFFILKAGAAPYLLLGLFIVADVIWRIIQLWMVHRILRFPVLHYCRDAYLPVAGVCSLMIACLYLTSLIQWDTTIWHLGRLLLILLLTAGAAFSIGLTARERKKIINRLSHHKA